MTQQLTQTFYLSNDNQKQARTLLEKTQQYTQKLLHKHYWTDDHLQEYATDNPIKPYKYFTNLDKDPFETEPDYMYNRYKRCVFNKIGNIFEAHIDEYKAFNLVTNTVEENHIRRIGKQKLRNKLDNTSEYFNWKSITDVINKLNSYYSTHGEFPDDYTTLVNKPEPNGTLSYSADDSQIHTLEYSQDKQQVEFSFKHPDSTVSSIDSYHDWDTTREDFNTFDRFELIVGENASYIGKPTLREEQNTIVLDVPIEVEPVESETVNQRVISCDLGVKTQLTTTALEQSHQHNTGEECDCQNCTTTTDDQIQLIPPEFVNHPSKDKLFRLIDEREHLLEKQRKTVTRDESSEQEKQSLVEQIEQVKSRIRNLREQIQHDIANRLVLSALEHNASTIVFENLDSLEAPSGMGSTSRSISSWARGELLERVKYKASLVGVEVETVNPWGTSRYCPRCGERGETVRAPDDREQSRSGGWFICEWCGFEGDRDYVGSLNVGRMVFTSGWKISLAKPVAYIEAGNHASFSSHTNTADSSEGRFASVRLDGDDSRDSDTISVGSTGCHQSLNDKRMIANRSRFANSSTTQIVLNHTKN